MPNEISVLLHNGSNYDYHFIIKELAKEFEGQFKCLGENTQKCKTFFSIEKEIRLVLKDDNGDMYYIYFYNTNFIDSTRFLASSLSNLAEGIHKVKCKWRSWNERLLKKE